MAENSKKDSGATVSTVSAVSKPQLLRASTIIRNNKIDAVTAQAVMTANRLKSSSRIEPGKFLKLVETFRNRKIKQTGRR